jgi:hypothetical protein
MWEELGGRYGDTHTPNASMLTGNEKSSGSEYTTPISRVLQETLD